MVLRFKGEEKDFITVWFTLRQRTLWHEAQFMPAPEEHKEEVFAYLLRRNMQLFGMAFALGPEDAVYLVGRVPARSSTTTSWTASPEPRSSTPTTISPRP